MTEAQGSSRRGRCRVQLFNHTVGGGFELFESHICQVEVDEGVSQDLWVLCELGIGGRLCCERLTVCFINREIVLGDELDERLTSNQRTKNRDGVGRRNFSVFSRELSCIN